MSPTKLSPHAAVVAAALAAGVLAALPALTATKPAAGAPAGPLRFAAPTAVPLTVCEVSASGNDGNVPANTRDDDLGTRWSADGDGVWIRYDLCSAVTTGAVTVAWYRGDQRRTTFTVQTSTNGTSWTTVIPTRTSSGATSLPETYEFSAATGRYLRIQGYGNSQNGWTSITEVDILGPGPGGTGSPTPRPTVTPSPAPTTSTPPPGATIVNVSSSAQLSDAMANAAAGHTILLADGDYSIGKLNGRHGTADAPITIMAARRGGAVVTGGQLEVLDSSYVTVSGLAWRNSNTLKITGSHHVRLSRNHFRLAESSSLKWIVIQGANSHHNRIDHNLFEEKRQLGNFITIDGSTTQQSQYDLIDHNHFRNIGPRATNEMEAIRVGWSAISQSSGHTTIESNLFENCDGDPEIISVKSNDNTLRYNTFRTSQGTLSLRHGNRSQVYGNFFLGGGKAGTGGVRVYGQDHKIYNNHFEGLTGTGYDAALQLDGGDVDTSGALSAHWRVYRATAVHNTFVNNVSNIEIGANYAHAPVDSVVADNIIVGAHGTLVNELRTPRNMTYAGNIAWPTGAANVGKTVGVRTVDPLLTRQGEVYRIAPGSPAVDTATGSYPFLTQDMDGQLRSATADVGADELSGAAVGRRPLTAADVGVDAS
ncbi:lyase [Micromonospora sp. HNM0581]|uniref:chondroitinase-B domain-containing protein n=1 Tax=Micromonospora sp. HNM0581 TaxID=2716341 RepID=UPI00146C8EB6|nr:chondroitinase-B domain-containing protein [Micromonospora sp. HNM0581]NLU79212.1 lyase [Micromonospora sp. HNM0581]